MRDHLAARQLARGTAGEGHMHRGGRSYVKGDTKRPRRGGAKVAMSQIDLVLFVLFRRALS